MTSTKTVSLGTTFAALSLAASAAYAEPKLPAPTNALCIDGEAEPMESGTQDVRDLIAFYEEIVNRTNEPGEPYEIIPYTEYELKAADGSLSHTFFNVDAGSEGMFALMADEQAMTACEITQDTYAAYQPAP